MEELLLGWRVKLKSPKYLKKLMDVIAEAKYVRISPRKVRPMASAIKKLPVAEALEKLSLQTKNGAQPILAALKTAIANATNNHKLSLENLKIKNILVNEGMKMKRRDKSHGARFSSGMIIKRTSHIKVILTD